MSELTYCVFLIALILLGLFGLVWANTGFDRMVRLLGPLSRWGMVVAPTRIGMSLAMIGTIILGVAALPPRLVFYPEAWRNALLIIFLTVVAVGFAHDLLARPNQDKSGHGR